MVRKVSPGGTITTVAGNGIAGYSGDGGPALNAQLNSPIGIAFNAAGDLYISDQVNHVIRRVAPNGIISTVAGNNKQGFAGDGGPATSGSLSFPLGISFDATENLLIADYGNGRVRSVGLDGTIRTVAGNSMNVPVPASAYGIGVGGPATQADVWGLYSLAASPDGKVYIADRRYNDIKVLIPEGTSPLLSISKSHDSDFAVNQVGAKYSVVVSNALGTAATAGPLTVTDLLPAGVSLQSMTGSGWSCSANTCNRSESLAPGANFPPITVSVDVNSQTPTQVRNQVTVTGSGSMAATASDYTTIVLQPQFTLTLAVVPNGTGSITPNPLPTNGTYSADTRVCLTATAASSWVFSSWSGATLDGSNCLIMNASASVTANFTVTQSGSLAISPGGVTNAATFTPNVAPGSIAAIFGSFLEGAGTTATELPLPTSLVGLSMELGGGAEMPLFYVSGTQVNAQVPWELAGQTQTTLTAKVGSRVSSISTLGVTAFAPGIFAINGQGAIQDSSYRLVDSSNPATVGNTVIIYCTGLGPVTNQPASGSPAPANPLASTLTTPTVTIGGASAKVIFSGLTPGTIGLYQVNAQVPATGLTGNSAAVAISIGGIISNTVAMAVEANQ